MQIFGDDDSDDMLEDSNFDSEDKADEIDDILEDSEEDSDDILFDRTDVNVDMFVDNDSISAWKVLILCRVSFCSVFTLATIRFSISSSFDTMFPSSV